MWVGEQKAEDKVAQDESIRWGLDCRATEDNTLPTHSAGFHPASLHTFLPQALTGLLSRPPSPAAPASAQALLYPEHDKLIVPFP